MSDKRGGCGGPGTPHGDHGNVIDGSNDNTETLGDALGPGVTKDDLAETERVLQRFAAVAVDEFDGEEEWLTTTHRAVARALEHYDTEIGRDGTNDVPERMRDDPFVWQGLLRFPPEERGGAVASGAYCLRRAINEEELLLYRAVEKIPIRNPDQ